jgi:hypothetical protein
VPEIIEDSGSAEKGTGTDGARIGALELPAPRTANSDIKSREWNPS